MSRYHGAVQATRIEHIHETERPRAATTCARCPAALNSPRPGGMCRPCRDAENFIQSAERRGIDLAALADDEFVVRIQTGNHRKKTARYAYRVVKETEMIRLEQAGYGVGAEAAA